MESVVIAVLLGALALLCLAMAVGCVIWIVEDGELFSVLMGAALGICCLALTVVCAYGTVDVAKHGLGPDDPCTRTKMVGKVLITEHLHGHIVYAGREVICP